MKYNAEQQTPAAFCLVGATGTGKTAAALALAEQYPIVVINADSRQVYRDLPIITAQPNLEEQARCPHRLYGFLALSESITAGRFVDRALPELNACRDQDRLPVLVGGTGLYLRALSGGLAPIPDVPEHVRREVLEQCATCGPEALHDRLQQVDPEYAAKIHPRDRQRVMRAWEVFIATGKSFSWWHAQHGLGDRIGLTVVGLRLDRDELHERVARRIDLMLEQGALAEAEHAWSVCPDISAPGYSGIGCKELLDVLHKRASLEQAKEQWLVRTRAYARRQETWFNNTPDVKWLAADDARGLARVFKGWLEELGAKSHFTPSLLKVDG